ncbi:MAG: rhomboid family intramembrane serine protease [Bacteroidetes bacterium]|nr:rhomboid family intramembrane serine protease [Bacteroidota bacterium]
MWTTEIIESVLGLRLSYLGVLPRTVGGLKGVFLAPFLHGEWSHIISNSLPFFVLSAILFIAYRRVAYTVFILIYLLTGMFVWLLARGGTFHIGASGLVYGLFGFIFFSGIFRGDIKSIALSLIIAFFYGGMVYGVFPGQPGISWESHLLGAVAGAWLAYMFRSVDKPAPPKWMEEPNETRSFGDFIERIERK